MDSNTLREKFLEFFKEQGHKIVESSSLVPADDPSVLFTSAGMNQFKSKFLGINIKDRRVATCQKCLRTDDLEKVGHTPGHHTFFEMLGNFSFGDYFKKGAIRMAWEFLTKRLNIDKNRLWISVHKEDKESFNIWANEVGIRKERIVKLSDKENFWPSHPEVKGPCGPCSEIFFDLGENFGCGKKDCSIACSCGRFVEVWNLVFTQFERGEKKALRPLGRKNIDTGMGLERLSALMQNKATNFKTDLFVPITHEVLKLVLRNDKGAKDLDNFRLNAIADHMRAICFAISDGVYPSNEDRGYVIRSLIRRALLFGKDLGIKGAFLYRLVDTLGRIMNKAYPELLAERENIAQIIESEEERFIRTLDIRLPEFIEGVKELSEKGMKEIPTEMLFKFYDTFGLPWDLMQEEASKFNIVCNRPKFSKLLDKQRKRSRSKSKLSSSIFTKLYDFKRSEIEFIDSQSLSAKVIAIFEEEGLDKKVLVTKASAGIEVEIVLDKTPFFAESGGQVGDKGFLENERTRIKIIDTKTIEGAIIHIGKVEKGEINVNDEVRARIDTNRRLAITRNHTATHLLQAALRKVLGSHLRQQGSLVSEEYFRFDFTHPKPIKEEELKKIEDLVNDFIKANDKLFKKIMSLDEAKRIGALAFFGERYGDSVRVVDIGGYSKELCGGSHLDSTGQIEFFKIMKESSIASGIRRIQASTGQYARQFEIEKKRVEAKGRLKRQSEDRQKALRQKKAQTKEKTFKEEIFSILEQAKEIREGIKCISIFQDACDQSLLRRMADLLKEKQRGLIIILGSIYEKKGVFIVSLTQDLLKKGFSAAGGKGERDILTVLTGVLRGSYEIFAVGGGKETLAQGSCKPAEDLHKLLKIAPDIIRDKLKEIKL